MHNAFKVGKSTFFFFLESVERVFDCHWDRKLAGQSKKDGMCLFGRLESATDLTGRSG